MKGKMMDRKKHLSALVALVGLFVAVPSYATLILSNTHTYDSVDGTVGAITIQVDVFDNYMGDFSKYLWQYTVTNNSYDPNPGTSNGFSGFETALPAAVADIADVFAPNVNWDVNCCSGQPVEWDIDNAAGNGLLIGETGVFGFTTLPRYITTSTGWFHTWESGSQTFISDYSLTAGETGPEVPDVLRPPITVPEPASLGLLGVGLAGLGAVRRRKAGYRSARR